MRLGFGLFAAAALAFFASFSSAAFAESPQLAAAVDRCENGYATDRQCERVFSLYPSETRFDFREMRCQHAGYTERFCDRIFAKLKPEWAAGSYHTRGDTYASRGYYWKAIRSLRKSVAKYDTHFARSNMALYYRVVGRLDWALVQADRAVEISSVDSPYAYYVRGHVYEALGDREKAIADFREALSRDIMHESGLDELKRLGAL